MKGVTRKYSDGFTKVGDDLRLPSKDEGWILYLGDVSRYLHFWEEEEVAGREIL
jgi:hypothetical protein